MIRIEGIGKRYRLGANKAKYLSLREEIAQATRRLVVRGNGAANEFWALRNVSFSVAQGEAVGIIGRNGAGKSTLLKVLSKITPPTEGQITLDGRVASLLEVGTGFHPELTGRENIFLNGAILGMTRREIAARFDEIVEFSEIEKFLDTPVKRYSSGMYVRLAFAVAAHLEPEILVVDEVLAVGDAQFQRKCLGKMQDVARGGRTVLFVSHNMAAVQALCDRAVVLQGGNVAIEASASDAISYYLQMNADPVGVELADLESAPPGLAGVWVEDGQGGSVGEATSGSEINVCLAFKAPVPNGQLRFAVVIRDAIGQAIACCDSDYSGDSLPRGAVSGVAVCSFPRLPLANGAFTIDASMNCNSEQVDIKFGVARLTILTGDFYGTGRVPPPQYGMIHIDHSWDISDAKSHGLA